MKDSTGDLYIPSLKENLLKVKKARKPSKRIFVSALIVSFIGIAIRDYLVSKGYDALFSLIPTFIGYLALIANESVINSKAAEAQYNLTNILLEIVRAEELDNIIDELVNNVKNVQEDEDEDPRFSVLNDSSDELLTQTIDTYPLNGVANIDRIIEYRDYILWNDDLYYNPEFVGSQIVAEYKDGCREKINL